MLNVPTPNEVVTPPPNGKGGHPKPASAFGGVAAAAPPPVEQKPDPAVKEDRKRLRAIMKAGDEIRAKKVSVERLNTRVAETTAARKAAMEDVNEAERELADLQEDLLNLSNGGFSERLNFADPAKAKKPAATTAAAPATGSAASEAWRSVRLDSLKPAISPGKLKVLAENNPPIHTIGEYQAWAEKKGQWFAKDLKGFGETGQHQVDDALMAYWKANPQPATASASPAATSDTVPLAKAMGKKPAAKTKAKKPAGKRK